MKIQLQLVAAEAPQLERHNCWSASQSVNPSVRPSVLQRVS